MVRGRGTAAAGGLFDPVMAQDERARQRDPVDVAGRSGIEGSSGRLVWIDRLRVVSIAAVVLLHCAAPLLLEFGESGSVRWWVGNLYDASVRWSVPAFVMVSGALVLGRAHRRPLREFLRRRFGRVAIPFLAWSVVYFYWQPLLWDMDRSTADLLPALLEGPISFHLWFVYMLLGLYLLAPLLGAFLDAARPRLAAYAVGLWLVGASVLPMAERLVGLETWFSPGRENSPLMLVGYFLLGPVLARGELRGLGARYVAPVLLLAVAFTAASTYLLTAAADGSYQPLFYEYYSLNVVVMSVAVFVLGARGGGQGGGAGSDRRAGWWRAASERVFGIYLVHVVVLDVLKQGVLGFTLDESTGHPVVAVPVLAATTFAASWAVVMVLERLPGVRRVLL